MLVEHSIFMLAVHTLVDLYFVEQAAQPIYHQHNQQQEVTSVFFKWWIIMDRPMYKILICVSSTCKVDQNS